MLSLKTVRPLSCAACATLGALGLPGAALAASQSFTATGDHSWIVPPAVKTVQVTVVGGRGGAGSTGGTKQAAGGPGATARVTLAVTPGETLYARVAGDGEPANGPTQGAGGYGGGGDGGPVQALLTGAPGGGGGGGASSVLPCGGAGCIPLVVGGGGGGGGGRGLDATPSINGGDGGDGDRAGSAGEATVSPFEAGGAGGQPGTTSAGGAPGANSYENPATAGQAGLGGNGGTSIGGGGGGGGGGIFGGGGGAAGDGYADFNVNTFRSGGGGGGGGGASGVPASATGTSDFALLATAAGAEPSVTFSWSSPPPSATTNAASGIEPTKATLAGTVDANLSSLIDCHFTIAPASPVGDRIPCAQQVSESAGPVQVTALVGGLKPATLYTVRLVAGNASGSSEGESVTFRTASGLSAAPRISRLRLSPARFRPGHSHAQRSRLASTTTIRFNLSRAAAIRFGVQRITHNHSAMRYATVPGSMRVSGRRGANRIRFAGVLGGRPLTPGRYRLAVDAATAGSASRPAYAAFTIVR